MKRARQAIILPDIHHDEHDRKAVRAVFNYIKQNREIVDWVVLLGDNMNCENISRHNKGKPRLKSRGGLQRDFDSFREDILDPIESIVKSTTRKVFFKGNHEDWLEQWFDENPEFEGAFSFENNLKLDNWIVIEQGDSYKVGKAFLLHGDQIGSGMHVSKKLVDSYCATAIMGHVHTAGMHTKMGDAKRGDKWVGYTLPTLGTLAPRYAKGRPNAFVNGFGIIEVWDNDYVNVYVPIIIDGRFTYGGSEYRG